MAEVQKAKTKPRDDSRTLAMGRGDQARMRSEGRGREEDGRGKGDRGTGKEKGNHQEHRE